MPAPVNVFISYRNSDLGSNFAPMMFTELQRRKYDVFIDKDGLRAGDMWGEKLREEVLNSDVLLILVESEVLSSDWMQREVDTARAAKIRVLPYVIQRSIQQEEIEAVLKKLGIEGMQFDRHDPMTNYDALCERINQLAEVTRNEQLKQLELLEEKLDRNRPGSKEVVKQPAENDPHRAAFYLQLKDGTLHPTQIFLAAGGMHDFYNIDVLVNSENDHLQMSRVHEGKTISSRLRYCGSWIEGRILEDSVQIELDAHVNFNYKGRPVDIGTVIPTNAGHPKSTLRAKNKARYIFHVVTVQVFQKSRNVTMIAVETDEGVRDCVINCLNTVEKVNDAKGLITPEQLVMPDDRHPYKDETAVQATHLPIQSIILPFFGTGHAGRPIELVVEPFLKAIRKYLLDTPDTSLRQLYISVYFEDDIELVKKKMSELFIPA